MNKYKIINKKEPEIYYKVEVEQVDYLGALYSIEIYWEYNDILLDSSFFDSVENFLKRSNGCFQVNGGLHFCIEDLDFGRLNKYAKTASHIGDLIIEPAAVKENNNWFPNGYDDWIFKRENWTIKETK